MVRMTQTEYELMMKQRGDVRAVEQAQADTPAKKQLRREQAREKSERLELMLLNQINAAGLPKPKRNAVIEGTGKAYKFDFVWSKQRLAVEIHGILYKPGERGGHQTPQGLQRDLTKLCEVAVQGWNYLAVTREHIESGQALAWIEQLLQTGKDK